MTRKKGHKTEVIPKGVRVDAMCPLHKDIPLKLLCVDDIKLCCVLCKYGGIHESHRVVDLSEVSEDNEVFSAAKVRERFGGVLKCDDGNPLVKRIAAAIDSIQKRNVSTREKVSQSFREAHERLNTEEAAVMDELEKVCNGAEEALQKALDEFRGVHEYSTALSEASSKTEGKASRLMELSIVCEMEKQRKALDELYKRKMKNLNVEWDSEKRKLSFTRHLINGAPVPKDVIFPSVLYRSVDVSWSCDEEELDEEKELIYCVEMKKFSESEEVWKEMYRGKDKKCSVSRLEKGVMYSVRIKSIIGGELEGMWSSIANFKTRKFDLND